MKKTITLLLLFLVIQELSNAQDLKAKYDSIKKDWYNNTVHDLDTARQDRSRALALAEFANYYKSDRPDSALFYGYKSLALARQIKFPAGECIAIVYITLTDMALDDDSKALQMGLQGLKIAEDNRLPIHKTSFVGILGTIYNHFQDYSRALDLLREAKSFWDDQHNLTFSTLHENFIGETYLMLNQPDSALYYCESAYKKATQLNVDWVICSVTLNLGKIQDKKGNYDTALAYFRESETNASEINEGFKALLAIAQTSQKMDRPDSALFYAHRAMELVSGSGFYSNIIQANILLSGIYEKNDPQKALQYSKAAIAYKDSLYNLGQATSLEGFTSFDEQQRQFEIQKAKEEFQSRLRTNTFLGITFTLIVIAFFLFITSRRKQKAKQKIEQAYGRLKSTQAQLIQSEKMASLGELTAGIAHEIQNPLNFVNNFSEVNKELMEEVEGERHKVNGERDEVLEAELLNDIKQNNEKISFHGKRADSIVKSMMQHSRTSTGVKEPTDINKLADEYLRLAFHGTRAKDKSFNVEMKTDFDESIGKINVVPQDIGRVLLNLFNNAFYATNEKKKTAGENYQPTVSIQTKKSNDMIEIRVCDNGNSIPQNIVSKIFQPFFTTKPTGQGTGLGLSLAYDIIKAHGGEIKVQTQEGEGTTFIIQLPR